MDKKANPTNPILIETIDLLEKQEASLWNDVAENLGITVLEEEKIFPEILHSKISKVIASQLFKIENGGYIRWKS